MEKLYQEVFYLKPLVIKTTLYLYIDNRAEQRIYPFSVGQTEYAVNEVKS